MADDLDHDLEEFMADVQKFSDLVQKVDRGESTTSRREVQNLETKCIQRRDRLKKHPERQSMTKEQKKKTNLGIAKLDKAKSGVKDLKFANEGAAGAAPADGGGDFDDMMQQRQSKVKVKKMDTTSLQIEAEIQREKAQQMLGIEEGLETVQEYYQDLDEVVQKQGETIDQAGEKVSSARDHVNTGTVDLQKASKHQKSSRKKMICVCVLLLALVGIVVILAVAV